MSDIFISYKRGPDADLVEGIVQAMRQHGFSVWWDRDIPARAPWEETIETELRNAHIVVVCWSPGAVASENVKSEARWAKERGKLLQAFVAPCDPPLFFGEHQGIQIFTPADLYGERFERLAQAARAMIDAALPPELAIAAEKLRNDKQRAAQRKISPSWRKEEPAQPWEATQFGLTLSLICTLILGGFFIAHAAGAFGQTNLDSSMWLTFVICGGVITPMSALFGGWAAYRMMAQFPRRVGFFTALFLSLVAGVIGALIPLAVAGAAASVRTQLPEPFNQETYAGLLLGFAAAAAIAGFVLTRFWTPFFLGLLRRALSPGAVRAVIALLAVGAPTVLTATALIHGGGAQPYVPMASGPTDASGLDGTIAFELRRTGHIAAADLAGTVFTRTPAVDARVRAKLGLAAMATDEDYFYALQGLPDRADWVLAADGSGDATSLAQIMAMSAGMARVKVKPGVYRDPPHGGDQYASTPGTLSMAFETSDVYSGANPAAAAPASASAGATAPAEAAASYYGDGHRRLELIGDGDRSQIVFEISENVRLSGSSRIEGVTIRAIDGKLPALGGASPERMQPAISMSGPSSLVNSVISGGGGDGVFYYGAGGGENSRASIRGNLITGALFTGIYISRGAVVDVVENRLDRVGARRWCIYVDTLDLIAVRSNDLTRCTEPNNYRIWSLQRSQARISNNAGATDTPFITRDKDGIDDTAWY